MPIVKITPDISVNTDHVLMVKPTDYSDEVSEPHVLIKLTGGSYISVPPEYTMGEICAALDGKCYYRSQWTDEVGNIDVCVLHGQNSQFGPSDGLYRACLQMRPYFEWPLGRAIVPTMKQSWEWQQKHPKAPIVLDSDHKPIALGIDLNTPPEPKRSFLNRLLG